MDRYSITRSLLRPVTAVRRRRARDETTLTKAVYEAHDYRPAMRRFLAACGTDPDLLIDVDLTEGAVVLDVGAFEGEWSTRILERADARGLRDLHIHAFEPTRNARERLRAAMTEDERFELHPFGLGGRDRDEVMTITGPGSSQYVDPTGPRGRGTATVSIRDVDSVLTALGVERLDLVKINIEGGEFELIDRLHDTGWLARTGPLIVQFHEFVPGAHPGRRRNRRRLRETHCCTWSYPWVYERWDPR